MPESDVREVLAIESGRSRGDVASSTELPELDGFVLRHLPVVRSGSGSWFDGSQPVAPDAAAW